ncbi:extracellular solute-binding protein [Sphaerisporangium sp. NPDC005288]|uniref:extracellular solute-binding protein n=1 Tax=Sphaerisporangium sp. NPDC005288 TaxID=3155114 RepID=UPI0033B06079
MSTSTRRPRWLPALLASAAVALAGCGGARGPATVDAGAAPSASGSASISASPSASGMGPSGAASSAAATPSPSSSPTPAATPSPAVTTLGPGEGSVTVLSYRGYAEYGGTDPAYNWVGRFETTTGCRVNLRFPASDDQLDTMAAGTAFDVVSAPPQVGGRLIAERKVAPITTSLLRNYGEIPSWLRSQRAITAGSQVYGVPYLWGWYATLYDSVETRPPAGAGLYSARGPVMLKDSPLTIADAALAVKRQRPKLGIGDPFNLTRPQLDAAMALLGERGGGDRFYYARQVQALQAFAGGSVSAGRGLPFLMETLRAGGHSVKAVRDDPATGWVDAWMVSATAASPNCAYRWIDWASSKDVQQQASARNMLAPANPGACAYHGKGPAAAGRARLAKAVCAAFRVPDASWGKKVVFAVLPGSDCEDRDGPCTDYAEWAARWRSLAG